MFPEWPVFPEFQSMESMGASIPSFLPAIQFAFGFLNYMWPVFIVPVGIYLGYRFLGFVVESIKFMITGEHSTDGNDHPAMGAARGFRATRAQADALEKKHHQRIARL